MGVHKQSYSPAFSFVCILMDGREEWVLVQLGSQHKRVERSVRPVFPDFLSVSCDYAFFSNVATFEITSMSLLDICNKPLKISISQHKSIWRYVVHGC